MKNPYRDMLLLQSSIMKRQEEALRIACAALDAVAAGDMTLTHGKCDHQNDVSNADCFLHFLYATLVQGMGYALPEDFAEIKFDIQQ